MKSLKETEADPGSLRVPRSEKQKLYFTIIEYGVMRVVMKFTVHLWEIISKCLLSTL